MIDIQRENYKFIMDLADKMKEKTMDIKRCQLYLQVATLADITEPDRSTTQQNTYNGIRQRSKLNWPIQGQPTETD